MSDLKIVVRIREQEADLVRGTELLKTYRVSTAAKGLGCEAGSYKTPTGKLRVARKIGDGFPFGSVFRGRMGTGEIWSPKPENPLSQVEDDLILTRILWLEGCDEDNANTLNRYIYFHGTNQESLLGQPVSHGCIRMSNLDVLELFDLIPVGTEVEILA
jgi:L,D-transpeptidase YbiS